MAISAISESSGALADHGTINAPIDLAVCALFDISDEQWCHNE